MYQKPYTCTEINVSLHFSDLRALILRYNNVQGPTFPEIQKDFNLKERSQSCHTILLSLSNSLYLYEFNRYQYLGLWSLWLQMTSWNFYQQNTVFGFAVLNRGGVEDTRLEAKAKDTKKIRGQGQGQPFRGQTLSRPRTGMLEAKAKDQGHKAQVLSKKKKKKRSSQKFFKRSPRKNAFQKIFQPLHKFLTFQKIVLSSSRGQANFRGLEASRPRPRPRTWPSRPRPRPRTSKSVLEDVLEAKDVLEDSTSGIKVIILYNIASILSSPTSHTFFHVYHVFCRSV